MIEGAIVFFWGLTVGMSISWAYRKYKIEPQEPEEKPYDKYKNIDGLYSRRAVREVGKRQE